MGELIAVYQTDLHEGIVDDDHAARDDQLVVHQLLVVALPPTYDAVTQCIDEETHQHCTRRLDQCQMHSAITSRVQLCWVGEPSIPRLRTR